MKLEDHGFFSYTPDDGITKFVIVYTSRTGSNFLSSKLDSHPRILCHHELFNAGGVHVSLGCEQQGISLDLGTVEERDRNPWRFLKAVFDQSLGHTAVGFKLASHENKSVLLSVLLNRRIKKIVLGRDNLLDTYITNLIAESTGQWIEKVRSPSSGQPEARPAGRPAVHVEAGDFKRYVRKTSFLYGTVRRLLAVTGQDWIDFEFNEIRDPARMSTLLRFLDVDTDFELTEGTKRQNPAPQREKITNYAELSAALSGSSYARYLSD